MKSFTFTSFTGVLSQTNGFFKTSISRFSPNLLITLLLFVMLPFAAAAQCPYNYQCTDHANGDLDVTFQVEAGNEAADQDIACDFVVRLGGTLGATPQDCSGGSFEINGTTYLYMGYTGGGNAANPLIMTFSSGIPHDPTDCPTNFEIAEAIGCGQTSDDGDLSVIFQDIENGQNCDSSNSYFSMTLIDNVGGQTYSLQASGNSSIFNLEPAPEGTGNIIGPGDPLVGGVGNEYFVDTIKAGYYILIFTNTTTPFEEYTFIYNHITQIGTCVTPSDLLIDKTITSGDQYASVGDIIMYSYEVTIAPGTNPITNPTVTDNKVGVLTTYTGDDGALPNDGILQDDETWIFTASYTITQEDIDAGSVTNDAFAKGEDNLGQDIFSDVDSATATLLPCNVTASAGTQVDVLCKGDATGSVVITPAGGTAGYTITPDQTGLAAGDHTFTVEDANGCTTTVDVTITEPAVALSATAGTQVDVLCKGDATGSVVITPAGGTAGYTITPDQTGLAAGDHTFTVEDANGCTTTVDVTITEPAVALSATAGTQVDVLCKGDATGSVVITPAGGTAGYTITPDQTGLAAGDHTFTVEDANGCTTTVDVTITEPAVALSATAGTQVDVLCKGDATGSVVITPAGGTAGYTITPDQTGLAAGDHTFTVEDANGCTTTVDVTITEPAVALSATAGTQVDVLCKGDATGSVVITPAGGTAGYTITPDQTGLAAGDHTFTVEDANGCTTTVDVTITEPAVALSATAGTQVDVLCKGDATGSVVITPAGGTAGYTITPDQTGLAAGDHTFTVEDANGCTTTVDVTITEPAVALSATAGTQVDVLCKGDATGSVVITPAGGTAGYTITPDQTGLAAGDHTFTVEDANGCTTTVDVTITEPAVALSATAGTQVDVLCKGDATGSVVITPAGGTAGYTITPDQTGLAAGDHTFTVEDANGCTTTVDVTITEPAVALSATAGTQVDVLCKGDATGSVVITPAGGTAGYTITPDQTGLAAGDHTFTVEDANGCTTTVDVTITEPAVALSATAGTQVDVLCKGDATGSVVITPAGGTAGYTITPDQTGLAAGDHTFTVEDANGCTTTVDVTITEPAVALSATAGTQVDVLCKGDATGSVVITPAGGTAGYTITPDQTGLAAGDHTFTVEDANGCTTTVDVTITEPAVALSATAGTQVDVLCKGDATGSVVITPAGGTAGYTITPDQTGLAAGDHTFTVEDANGCTTTVDVTITEPAVALSATAGTQVDVLCKGDATGSVVITPAGGTAGYTITPDQTGLAAGDHTFTVEDANGCTTTVDVTITEPAVALSATAGTQVDVLCKGDATGSVVITPAGGTAGYTITPDQTGLAAGDHTFTVEDANGCTTTVDVTITEPAVALSATAGTQVDVLCKGDATGSVVITPAGGTAGYTITPDQTGLAAGDHTFTVEDANGCTTTVDVTITEPAVALSATAGTQVDVLCKGDATGSVVITPAGGTAGYTITPDQTGLAAGDHTFTVEDANGCTTTVDVTITEPAVALSATAGTQVDVLCKGDATGSVVITPAGGTAGYTITPDQTGLAAGDHTFTVEDANGCTTTVDVTITEPAVALSATAGTQVDVLCKGDATGSVVITPAGGTAGYTITPDQTGLAAGDHTFTVEDANGCTTTVDVTITEPAVALSATAGTQVDVLCKGDATGSVVITPAGGTAGYTITPAQTGLIAGDYTFTVEDANGCTTTVDVTITEPAVALSATAGTQVDVLCKGDATGSVVITPAGGTAGYTITPDQTGLAAGDHTFTVEDANGCTTTVDVTITEPAVALSATAGTQVDVLCKGDATGSVVITPAGGTAGYTITPAQTGLIAGDHTFTVEDANGCTTTVDVTITEPAVALSATAGTQVDVLCKGDATGSVVITPAGGTAGYTITPAQTGLIAGDHTFTVEDANGCTTTVDVTITEPAVALSATAGTQVDVLCKGDATGSVVITPAGGTAGYTITPAQTGLIAGDHTFTVEDANGCTTTVDVTITEPAVALSATAVSQVDVLCFGESTGSVVITPAGRGYTITPDQTGLAAGDHTFTVEDANGCTTTVDVTILGPENDPLSCEVSQDNPATCQGDDGVATVTVTGGSGSFTYLWDNGNTEVCATDLSVGPHTVTVTDSCGTTTECNVTITGPENYPLSCEVSQDNPATCQGDDGVATVTVTGGSGSFTYLWDNGNTEVCATDLSVGPHTVTVTDSCGTTTECNVTITGPENDPLSCEVSQDNPATCQGDDGVATVTVTGGSGSFTYLWDNGNTEVCATDLSVGPHTVTVTDSCGTTTECNVTITGPENDPLSCEVSQDNPATCQGDDGVATVTVTGGSGSFTYLWDNGNTEVCATDLSVGPHTVTVTDSCGTTTECNVTITGPENYPLLCEVSQDNPATCQGDDGVATVTVTGGSGSFTYLWDNGNTEVCATDLSVGPHTVTVTDSCGTTTECNVTITGPDEALTATTTVNDVSCYYGSDGSIDLHVNGGTEPFTFTWSGPGNFTASSEDISGLPSGIYDVVITDVNGCTFNCGATVDQPNTSSLAVNIKVFLDGPYNSNTGLMNDDLRSLGALPTSCPYDVGSCDASVFNATGNNAIVDWVWVELRDKNSNTTVLAATSALIQRDGDVVSIDGESLVSFDIDRDDYFVAVAHRNHLGIITADPVKITCNTIQVNLTQDVSLIEGGTNAVTEVNTGYCALTAGDFDGNGQIQNTDLNGILPFLGTSSYSFADMDMNNQIQNTDINILLPNLGLGSQVNRNSGNNETRVKVIAPRR